MWVYCYWISLFPISFLLIIRLNILQEPGRLDLFPINAEPYKVPLNLL